MKISSLLNQPATEKKDCKIGLNGVIWLRKGEYGSRIAGKHLTSENTPKTPLSKYQKQYIEQFKLTNNDLNYDPQNNRAITRVVSRSKTRSEKVKKLYSVNKRKVRARLQNFINTEQANNSMYFYSISFPTQISYQTAYRLLNSTLTVLRQSHNLHHYLWITERQKNGTIHFHLATFTYIKGRKVNEIVKKYLKHDIKNGNLNWSISAANKYNGVDIAKDRKTKIPTNFASKDKSRKIAGYLTKYVTKSTGGFERQAWNCSRSLAAVSDGICCNVEDIVKMFSIYDIKDNAVYANDWCMFFRWIDGTPDSVTELLYKINSERVKNVSLPLRGFGILA